MKSESNDIFLKHFIASFTFLQNTEENCKKINLCATGRNFVHKKIRKDKILNTTAPFVVKELSSQY